jgi:hypothetical protein
MKIFNFCAILTILTFLFGCNSNNFDKEEMATAVDTISATGLTDDSVKMVKTASMDFKVKDVYQSAKRIAQAARTMNGFITNRHLESVEENSKRLAIEDDSIQVISSYIIKADMLVRVPSEKLDDFIEQVSTTASFIKNSNLRIEDKSLQYLASNLKRQNREQLLNEEGGKKRKTIESIHLLNQKDQMIEQELANKQVGSDVKYSTIQLSFFQDALIRKEIVANNDLAHYRLPFLKSIKTAFFNGWEYFLSFLVGLTSLWMFIVVAIVIAMAFRHYKIRKANV